MDVLEFTERAGGNPRSTARVRAPGWTSMGRGPKGCVVAYLVQGTSRLKTKKAKEKYKPHAPSGSRIPQEFREAGLIQVGSASLPRLARGAEGVEKDDETKQQKQNSTECPQETCFLVSLHTGIVRRTTDKRHKS